ncbi:hypothetical protein BKA58DRAFT_161492 [Alternaria rosae]|uniref:uncharacterized protein n=1 Tax=Alternaria rosae TaxID=1187941 RepID=UPI001E8CC289|nr:uncharacterized protein BKA58DRAFT_161492 [Alternaria rosae]KAH6873136.1 hypothetical protein BKA58DRAFT_161492 [Alternaria rosae]
MDPAGPPPSSPLLQQRKEPATNTVEDSDQSQSEKRSTAGSRGCFAGFLGALLVIPRGIARGWNAFTNAILRIWRKGWTAETCSCIFALLSLIGLIVTLTAHQNRPLPDWPQIVSINSIVSLFSMMIRAGVSMVLAEGISQSKWQWFRKARKLEDMARFDSASRGAWGSVLFIFGLRIKKPYFIATMGAFVTVMSAFTGFAAQQLIVFNDCLRPDESAAVGILRSNAFDKSGERKTPTTADEYLPLTVAMDVGILQPLEDTTNLLSYGCKTGNCTFPDANGAAFSTLGVGYWCQDVTSQVVETPLNYDSEVDDYLPPAYLNGAETGSETIINTNSTNTSIPLGYDYGIPLKNGTKVRNIGLSLSISDNLFDPPIRFPLAGWPGKLVTDVSQPVYNGTIATIGMIYVPYDSLKYQAMTCGIYPTVNTIKATYHNGVLKEEIVKSVRIGEDLAFGGTTSFRLATKQTIRNGTETTCDVKTSETPGYLAIARGNIDAAPVNTTGLDSEGPGAELVWYPEDCVWSLFRASTSAIQTHLVAVYGQQFLMDIISSRYGNAYMRVLWDSGQLPDAPLEHVSSIMTNLTNAMNTVLRTHGAEGYSKPAEGTMWYTTTCIEINWTWITFPAVMIALSAIFLLLVHIESRGVESGRLWKSSILATLFCEMDDVVTEEAKPVERRRLEEVAASSSVSLGKDNNSLRLVARQA